MDLMHVPHPWWPEPGAATVFCWTLGILDTIGWGFIVSKAFSFV